MRRARADALPFATSEAHGEQTSLLCVALRPCTTFATHGKTPIWHVPEKSRMAKFLTHGKLQVSGSGGWIFINKLCV